MPINDNVSKHIKQIEKRIETNGPNLWNQQSVCSLCITKYTHATNADKLALVKLK